MNTPALYPGGTLVSDRSIEEIQPIVQRVLNQSLGLSQAAPAQPAEPTPKPAESDRKTESKVRKVVAIGADHGGYELK